MRLAPLPFLGSALLWTSAALAQPVVIEGDVPDDGEDYFFVPVTVPTGTVEMEIAHDDMSAENILDWGLYDPEGFRGWGGGNEEPIVIGDGTASRSYIPGPLPAGGWRVIVGKAKIVETPARYRLEVTFRDTETLPEVSRTPYSDPGALESGQRWYAGDFHVHSRESGDATAALADIVSLASSRGLDFVAISDHNTVTGQDFFADAPGGVLLLPSAELTTYAGHANAIGLTTAVEPFIGIEGRTIDDVAQEVDAAGALLTINHPNLDLGDLCIGCAWDHDLPVRDIAAVEIQTGGYDKTGFLFGAGAVAFWDDLCEQDRVAAVGGSDDHDAGVMLGATESPIGSPTTMVFADDLSVAAIVDAVRRGRTVVKLQGPDDPMVELSPRIGSTAVGSSVEIRATVTGTGAEEVVFVVDGIDQLAVPIVGDPFVATTTVSPRIGGESRVRAELRIGGNPRVITSHVWLQGTAPPPPREESCGCRVPAAPPAPFGWLASVGALVALARRRRQR